MSFAGRFLICPAFVTFLSFILIQNVTIVDAEICNQIDIRNDPKQFKKIENCTTIIGNLYIVLIERGLQEHYEDLSYPKLREITGYFILFRVYGLRSLKKLFPNLTVIRGQNLCCSDYAFVVWDMPDLIDIGLISLTQIQRGQVMIYYNPSLCFGRTVDWEMLTELHMGKTFGNLVQRSDLAGCAKCHEKCYIGKPKDEIVYCWTHEDCQEKEQLVYNGIKCDPNCLGGCTNTSAFGCKVCRFLQVMTTNECVYKCPPKYYKYSSFCVTPEYCEGLKRTPVDGECRPLCPHIIYAQNVQITNTSMCAKECPDIEIDSVATSDLIKGCQIIKGDLYIHLKTTSLNTMNVLQKNLGEIEEIEGILKIYRSPAITSLTFLKSLRIIHGIKPANDVTNYTFIVISNDNLQQFWNLDEKKSLELKRGHLLVHYNSKLCLNTIHSLQKLIQSNRSGDDICPESNGYDESCTAKSIVVDHNVLNSTSVEIVWDKFIVDDSEKIMGYIIYYIIAPYRNISRLGIDACSKYGWQSHFILNLDLNPKDNVLKTELHDLHQNRQYAYYVKAQVVLKENEESMFNVSQGLSIIKYFETKPDTPSQPYVETVYRTHDKIHLKWSTLEENENDLIEYYKIDLFSEPEDHLFMDSRDYCKHPNIIVDHGRPVTKNNDTDAMLAKKLASCRYEFDTWKLQHGDSDDPAYDWHNYRALACKRQHRKELLDEVKIAKYVNVDKNCGSNEKCKSLHRSSRDISDYLPIIIHKKDRDRSRDNDDINLGKNFIKRFNFTDGKMENTFDNLKPYTMYIFHIFACNILGCSPYTLYFNRTHKLHEADDIQDLKISSDPNDRHRLYLDFSEPQFPNGLTMAFHIEIHDVLEGNTTTICITRKDHYNHDLRYTFDHLKNGSYNLRVKSISMASAGSYTENHFITIPYYMEDDTWGLAFWLLIIFTTVLIIILIDFCSYVGMTYYEVPTRKNLIIGCKAYRPFDGCKEILERRRKRNQVGDANDTRPLMQFIELDNIQNNPNAKPGEEGAIAETVAGTSGVAGVSGVAKGAKGAKGAKAVGVAGESGAAKAAKAVGVAGVSGTSKSAEVTPTANTQVAEDDEDEYSDDSVYSNIDENNPIKKSPLKKSPLKNSPLKNSPLKNSPLKISPLNSPKK